MGAFEGLLREAFVVCAILALPVLGVVTLVGTAVAILQAATQVQEQTLSLLPKIIVVALFVTLSGPFALRLCAGLFADALTAIPSLVRGG